MYWNRNDIYENFKARFDSFCDCLTKRVSTRSDIGPTKKKEVFYGEKKS